MIALARREIRNHGIALAGTAALAVALGILSALAQGLRADAPTAFGPIAGYIQAVLPIVALVAARRLVAHEHRARTRLLLASLPVDPAVPAAVKLALVTFTVLSSAVGLVGLCVVLGSPRPESDLVLRVLGRVGLFGAFAAGGGFLVASLGRYFLLTILVPLVGLLVLPSTVHAVRAWNPFTVVASTLATDPRSLSIPLVAATVSLTLLTAAGGVAIARARSGTIAAGLFAPMSHREAMRWTLALLLPLMLHHPERHRVRRYELPGAQTLRTGRATVQYLPGTDNDAAIAGEVARALDRAAAVWPGVVLPRVVLLGTTGVPEGAVAITHPSDDAVLVQYHPGVLAIARDRVASRALQGVALHITRDDAAGGDTAWVLEGFGRYISLGSQRPDPESVRRALAATGGGALRPADLRAWRVVRERLGDDGAESVAATLLQTAAARRGEGAVRAMLGEALAPRSGRSMLASWWAPSARAAWRSLGMTPEALTADWSADLRRAPGEPCARIAPRMVVARGDGVTRGLGVVIDQAEGLADDGVLVVEVWRLSPEGHALERGLAPGDMDDDERLFDGSASVEALRGGVRLPVVVARGDRVLWRVRPAASMAFAGAGLRREVAR